MLDIFRVGTRAFHDAFFFEVRCQEGEFGYARIYRANRLILNVIPPDCDIEVEGTALTVACEPKWFTDEDRATEPHSRPVPYYFSGHLSSLEPRPLTNGSRYLISLEAVATYTGTTHCVTDTKKGYVVEKRKGLEDELVTLLTQLGIPDEDMLRVLTDILTKLDMS